MTCYEPPPLRPSLIRRIAGLAAGILALSATIALAWCAAIALHFVVGAL